MNRKYKLPELLAPAGDKESLIAAVSAGADAVYVGGKRFGARAYAKNFENEELRWAVRYCHLHGVRLYVTLNTLVYDKELDEALQYAEFLHAIGVDALIVADLGVVSLLRRRMPDLELHASTQMGIHNTPGADFAYSIGCSRVVLARECSYNDIKQITERALPECEVFVHGALCVCHSGQCLFSSLVGGRSGNRGECAQPCRLPYGNKYPISLTDLSLAKHVKALIDCGVASLKIEGRMKSPEYVYRVTSIYRRLLDEARGATVGETSELREVFSRGGFTDGYFTGKKFSPMTGVRSEEDKQITKEKGSTKIKAESRGVKILGRFRLGQPSELTLKIPVISRVDGIGTENSDVILSVSVKGEVCRRAESSPLHKDGLADRLSKLGNTPFSASDIEIELDEGVNLSPGEVNALRRAGAEALELLFEKPIRQLLGRGKCEWRTPPKAECGDCEAKKLNTALFLNPRVFEELTERSNDVISQFDIIFLPLESYCHTKDVAIRCAEGVYVPPVIMERELEGVMAMLKCAAELGAKYALIGNVSHVSLCKEAGLRPVGDFRLNVSNKWAKELLLTLGVSHLILSPELTLPMARDIGGGVITFGRIPLMLTERCFVKENFGCDRCGSAYLTDRKGARFPILREFGHRNLILNSSITYMGDRKSELSAAKIRHSHFIFTTEGSREAAVYLNSYRNAEPLSESVRRVGRRAPTV